MKSSGKKVLSASRRVDLVSFYPEYFIQRIKEFDLKEIHTLVIWTKNPENIFKHNPLLKLLKQFEQIYFLVTITGLGKTFLEPNAPLPEKAAKILPDLIELSGNPERVVLRYDPLISAKKEKELVTNIDEKLFNQILSSVSNLGIKRVITSYVTVYTKVQKRLEKNKIELINHPKEEIEKFILEKMIPLAKENKMELSTCVLPDLTKTGCIDGRIIQKLHPKNYPCSLLKDQSQRKNCHCTESIDLGKWFSCYHNCLYCYGNPKGNLH